MGVQFLNVPFTYWLEESLFRIASIIPNISSLTKGPRMLSRVRRKRPLSRRRRRSRDAQATTTSKSHLLTTRNSTMQFDHFSNPRTGWKLAEKFTGTGELCLLRFEQTRNRQLL
ncbi:hypothetical protein AgCh_028140 [Apium graveolens]